MLGFVPQPNLQARLRGDAHVVDFVPQPNLQIYYRYTTNYTGNEIPKA